MLSSEKHNNFAVNSNTICKKISLMKKIIFAFATLLLMAACTQNKPSQATENEKETVAQTEAADTINPLTKLENMK